MKINRVQVKEFVEQHRDELEDAYRSHERYCEQRYADMVFELSMKYGVDEEIVEKALLKM